MAWARVDDQWWSHPKVLGLSLAARGLWITTLSWSCAQRRSLVPGHLVRLVAEHESDDLAAELVDAGLWITTDQGWRIHDWAEFQDRSLSEKRAESGRKGGIRSGETRSKREANEANVTKQAGSKTDLLDEPNGEAGPIPSHPVPEAAAAFGPVTLPLSATSQRVDRIAAVAAFEEFHLLRAIDEAKGRKRKGLNVVNPSGLARKSIASDPEFRSESERLWSHRDCTVCNSSGFTETYAPGSGQVRVPCQEVVDD